MPDNHGADPHPPPQRLLNESWPAHPRGFPHAPERVPVIVRLDWEHDGPEWRDGHAIKWDRRHVYVTVRDRRLHGAQGVWVDPSDVQRRHEQSTGSAS